MIDDASEFQRRLDVVAIQEVLHRYCRAIDRVDRELLASCYHPDAVDRHPGFTPEQENDFVTTAINQMSNWGEGGGMMHYLPNIVVEIDGDIAWAESYYHAVHWGMPRSDPKKNYEGGGRYLDRFERRDGLWKIAERTPLPEWRKVYPEGSVSAFDNARRNSTDPSYDRTSRSAGG